MTTCAPPCWRTTSNRVATYFGLRRTLGFPPVAWRVLSGTRAPQEGGMAQRRARRRFTREYKAQAVQRLIERGRPLADIAVCGPAAGLGRASHSRGPAPGGAPSGATPDRAADARHGFASPTGSATPAPNPRQPPRSAHRPQSAGSLLGGRASRHRVARRPLRHPHRRRLSGSGGPQGSGHAREPGLGDGGAS